MLTVCLFIWSGCAGSGYAYRAVTDNCNCDEFRAKDERNNIEYRFRARYRMDHGIVTTIEIGFMNKSNDTLFLDPGVVKISSRNIDYRYNNKFIPLPILILPPGSSDDVIMTGTDTSEDDDWNKIAGEQLKITIKGLRLGFNTLGQQSVVFIPVNPKLGVP